MELKYLTLYISRYPVSGYQNQYLARCGLTEIRPIGYLRPEIEYLSINQEK